MSGLHPGDEQRGRSTPESGLATTVYAHLRAIAQVQMSAERPGHTLTATALVHEAFLRVNGVSQGAPVERAHFLHAAAEAMRRILIEHARARARQKRGGAAARISLDAIGDVADLASTEQGEQIVAFDDAFRRLEESEPRLADIVRLRFFAGLSNAETGAALGVSERTVNNDWAYARAWLARELKRVGEG
jgi:RNA polymerase sigma factor (TIGR02999 family)